MSELEVYSFEDVDGVEQTYITPDPTEAKAYARKYALKMIANVYEFVDSEVVEDNTGGATYLRAVK